MTTHIISMKQFLTSTFILGVLLLPLLAVAQNPPVINSTVSGKVVDARTKEFLIGATVTIKGTTNGSVTDLNGQFNLLTGQKLPFAVVVSFVGYQTKEISISDNNVEIQLEE